MQEVDSFFREEIWSVTVPEAWRVPSITLTLSADDIEFMTDDDTNPDMTKFSKTEEIGKSIQQLGGAVFVKLAGRSSKDSNELNRKIRTAHELVMLVKMSEYLTEGLCQQDSSHMILRKYDSDLQSGNDQFRVYSISGKVIGICQKQPSFLSGQPSTNQIQKLKHVSQTIHAIFQQRMGENQQQSESFVAQMYCSPSGNKTSIITIEPFHINALSLFTEEQLKAQSTKKTPLIKMVEKESQLKDTDLSSYRVGSELQQLPNVHEWINLMKQSQTQPHTSL